MFRGANPIAVDLKGRIAVPVRYREDLMNVCGGQLVITVEYRDRCLLMYPRQEWLEVEKKLHSLPAMHEFSRRLQRFMVGHAKEVEMDRQGRMLIPSELRELAGLDRQVVLVGQVHKFEIWDETRWNEQWETDDPDEEFVLPEGYESLTF